MKKFLIKIFILSIIILTTIICLMFFIPERRFITPAEYKHELLKKTNSTKLILIGGSNVFVGIYSEKISKELNINVVNMGFNFSYGLKYMIEQIKYNIYKDDIIVIIPEQFLFIKNYFNGNKFAINTIFTYRPLDLFICFQDFKLFKHIIINNFNHFILILYDLLKIG